VQSYWWPDDWAICSWGLFNSTLLPAFPFGQTTTSFGRRSFPDRIKHVVAPHFSLQVSQYLNWHYGSHWIDHGHPHAWPPHLPHLTPLDFYLWGYLKDLVYQEKLHTWNKLLMVHHGLYSSHMEQSWKNVESNTCCFKMKLLVHSQCRRSLQTASHVSMYVMSQCKLNICRIPFLCTWLISSIKII
jgi:hypothetical protein